LARELLYQIGMDQTSTAEGDKMEKNRIERVWIERKIDECPDTSHMGEYTDDLEPGVIVRDYGEFYEKLPTGMERDYDGRFIGKADPEVPQRGREYRGFIPYAGDEKVGTRDYYKYGIQDFKRMEGLNNGDWLYIGVIAKVEIVTGGGTIQILRSGGLWGIESDCGDYIQEVEKEELESLEDELKSIGFGQRAIDYAIKNAEISE